MFLSYEYENIRGVIIDTRGMLRGKGGMRGTPKMKENGCYIIGEIAQAQKDPCIAHKYIDEAADIGLDAVKFQAHLQNMNLLKMSSEFQ